MERPRVDITRTGVKAHLHDGDLEEYGPPGAMVFREDAAGRCAGFLLACPGCGQFVELPIGDPNVTSWMVLEGDTAEVGGLTLQPWIDARNCCGWKGYLRRGYFHTL